ncbi:MAG: formin domain containing, partial [Trebouxia sp. A1-2]
LAESTGLKKYRFIFEDAHGQRTQLAAHTAKERQDWMNAISEATVRSGSAGASSSKGGTPVASSHKRYNSLEHTPVPLSKPGETEGSAPPPEIPLLSMKAVTQAAAAEASLQDTFTTPLPLPRPVRRASADIPNSTLTASSHLRKAHSHREGISKSPSGVPGTPFTPPVYKVSSHQQLPRKQSIFSTIKDVLLGSAQSDSTSGPRSETSVDASSNSNAYNASLKPLKSKPPERQLLDQAGDMLPAEAIMEQFDRAQQYVLKNKGEFTAEQQDKLQGWMGAVQVSRDKGITTAAVAAAAMFVLVVTRSNDEWSSWSEHDNMFVSPENMISEVQRWPSRPTLEDLKECLDYCSTSWVGLYCRLGGAHLLLEALNMHREAAQEGQAEAHDAVLASLQCMQALTSGGGGMDAAIAAPDFVQCLCSVLDPDDQDCSKLVVEMLTKLCLYSADGYCAAIQPVSTPGISRNLPPLNRPHHPRPPTTRHKQGSFKSPSTPTPTFPLGENRGFKSTLPSLPHLPQASRPAASPLLPLHLTPPPPPQIRAAPTASSPRPPPPPPSRSKNIAAPPPPPPPPPSPRLAKTTAAAIVADTPAATDSSSPSLPTTMSVPPLRTLSSEAATLVEYPPPPGPPFTAVATPQAAPATAAPVSSGVVPPVGKADPGHLIEAVLKCKVAEPTYKGQSDYVSIIASASTPSALPPAGFGDAEVDHQEAAGPCQAPRRESLCPSSSSTSSSKAAPTPSSPRLPTAAALCRIVDMQQANAVFLSHCSSCRGGPAPPAALVQRPRVDPGPRPSCKMKSFFWDKLPENRLQGTFWQDCLPPYSALHVQEVETLFQAMQRSARRPASRARQKLAVLDLKRATAVGIRMSRLRVPWQRIPHAIIKLDFKAFQTADDVRAVLQCVPTQDEANLLQSYVRAGGKLEGLSDAELFCLDLMKILRVEARLSTFLTRFEAQQQLAEARGILEGHQKAHEELKGSSCMAAALQLTLAMGNFLNWGTRLAQGAGFRLRNLPKLQDTKSLDGKTSLLSYIARQLSTGHPPAALLAHEMPHVVGPALKTSVQEVTDMIDKTSVAMDLVRSELKRSTATVKVSLTVSPCVQQGSIDFEQKSGLSPKSSVSPGSSNKQAQSPAQEALLVAPQQHQQHHDTKSNRSEEQQNMSRSEEEQEIACQQHTPDAESQRGLCCSCSPGRQKQDEDSHKEVLVELLSDNYQDVMSQTVREVDKELKLARQLLGHCKESFSSLVSFYGENAQAFANDAVFWSDVVAFVQKFTACQRALRKQMQEQQDMTRRKDLRRSQTSKTSQTSLHAEAARFSRSPSTTAAADSQPTV